MKFDDEHIQLGRIKKHLGVMQGIKGAKVIYFFLIESYLNFLNCIKFDQLLAMTIKISIRWASYVRKVVI